MANTSVTSSFASFSSSAQSYDSGETRKLLGFGPLSIRAIFKKKIFFLNILEFSSPRKIYALKAGVDLNMRLHGLRNLYFSHFAGDFPDKMNPERGIFPIKGLELFIIK